MKQKDPQEPANRGIPVYVDEAVRRLADPSADAASDLDWHPADSSTFKLWRCLEVLRDVRALLKDISPESPVADRRRRIKILATPLLSLYQAVRDLANDLQDNPNSRSRLSTDQLRRLGFMRDTLVRKIPADQNGVLREIRDKISAHMDKKVRADDARDILDKAEIHVIGYWLHLCLVAFLEFTNLDVYGWATGGKHSGYTQLMTAEPFLVTFALEDGKPHHIVRLDVVKSPNAEIVGEIREVIRLSQWMFRADDPHIRSLFEGEEKVLGFYTDLFGNI